MSTYGMERCGGERGFGYWYILHPQPTQRINPDLNFSTHPAAYFFFGGLLMILGSIGEWIVGNTFPFVVFGTFGKPPPSPPLHRCEDCQHLTRTLFLILGAFWLTFGGTLVPSFNSYGAYVTSPAQMAGQDGNPGNPLGLQTPGFNASFAFFLVFMGAYNPLPSIPTEQTRNEKNKINLTPRFDRTRLLHLPHLLPPHKHRLLPHLLLPRLRLWLPLGRLLEPGSRV